MRITRLVWVLAWAICVQAPARGADAGSGRVLYETWCNRCHDVSVHVRNARKATSFPAIRAQVARWSAEVGGAWSEAEIDDVTLYLNGRYYFFRCPQRVCGTGQAVIGTGSANACRSRGPALC